MVNAYSAYEKGYLPVTGGLDEQPALFQPMMTTIASALQDEDDFEKAERDRIGKMAGARGSKPGHAYINPPKRG